MTEPMTDPAPRPAEDEKPVEARVRPVRLLHDPERLPVRAERFLGLLDRSRRR